ncbi:MAG: hypothetical protein ABGX27_07865 [Desulfurobacteriaceae bacterium]
MNKGLFFLVFLLLVFGCGDSRKRVVVSPIKEKTVKTNKEKEVPIVFELNPLPVQTPTLSEMKNFEKEFSVEDKTVTLSFDGTSLRQALLAIGKITNYNVILPEDLEGKVYLELKGGTLENALKALLEPFGYSFKIDGNNIYIITKETKVFHVNLLKLQRTFSSSINASSGGGRGTSGTTSTSTTSVSLNNNYSLDPWENLRNAIEVILKEDKSASYSIEPLSGTVIVSAKPSVLKKVEKLLNTLNKEAERQVLIEAKIVEVQLNKQNEYGVNWNKLLLGKHFQFSFIPTIPTTSQLEVIKVFSSSGTNPLIGALSQFGKVNVLSSPRILAMNGQPAVIKVGKDYMIVYKTLQRTVYTDNQTITNEQIRVENILTDGLVLTIVPKIGDNGEIVLNITPAINRLDKDTSLELPIENSKAYSVGVRQLNTVVKLKDGETVILGGLIENKETKDTVEVPILSRIPLLGSLFKYTYRKRYKSELVIMLTPKMKSNNGE